MRYLESRLIALAKEAKRATLINGTHPSEQGKIPEPDEVEMEEFIIQARLLLGTLGYDLFEPSTISYSQSSAIIPGNPAASCSHPEFSYTGDGFSAQCIVDIDAGQFIVMSGSLARKQEAASLQQATRILRKQLLANGVLLEDNEQSYKFVQDYSFSSASSAAQVVAGTSVNGRNVWRMADNKTYAEWQDSQISHEENNNS